MGGGRVPKARIFFLQCYTIRRRSFSSSSPRYIVYGMDLIAVKAWKNNWQDLPLSLAFHRYRLSFYLDGSLEVYSTLETLNSQAALGVYNTLYCTLDSPFSAFTPPSSRFYGRRSQIFWSTWKNLPVVVRDLWPPRPSIKNALGETVLLSNLLYMSRTVLRLGLVSLFGSS